MDKKQMHMTERLLAYLRGELSPDEAEQLEQVLEDKAELSELGSLLKSLQDEGEANDWRDLSESIRSVASRMFEQRSSKSGRTDPTAAVLVFDSRSLPMPDGIRPAATDSQRLRYCFDRGDIDITVYPVSPESVDIFGRVSHDDNRTVGKVELRVGRKTLNTDVDEFGVFEFHRVPTGTHKFVICDDNGKTLATGTLDS